MDSQRAYPGCGLPKTMLLAMALGACSDFKEGGGRLNRGTSKCTTVSL